MPFSFAIFLAKGEAKILPSFTTCVVEGVIVFVVGAEVVTAGALCAAGAGVAAVVVVEAPPFMPATIGAISKPCCPMIQSKSFTKIFSPALAPWYNKIPSLYDSNSIVALSVSMSANTSPFLTESPICLCHPAITPSVIVSLNLGINTTSSIAEKSAVGTVGAAGVELAAGAAEVSIV